MPTFDLPADPRLTNWPETGTIAIIDLEYTAWEGSIQRAWSGPSEWREIVDIGCILVDAGSGFDERSAFELLVKPQRNPVLSDYFSSLTGIRQADIDGRGVELPDALYALASMLYGVEMILSNGHDGRIIRENCMMQQIEPPQVTKYVFDFRHHLADTLHRPTSDLTSSALPKLAGITFAGQAHSALHDCRAIARSFAAWRRAGVL